MAHSSINGIRAKLAMNLSKMRIHIYYIVYIFGIKDNFNTFYYLIFNNNGIFFDYLPQTLVHLRTRYIFRQPFTCTVFLNKQVRQTSMYLQPSCA